MKKLLFFMFAMLVCPNLHAQKLQVRVDSLSASINWSNIKIENLNVKMENIEGSIEGLTKQVENLSYLVEAQKEVISQEQSAIENSMGAVNTLLAVFSLIITLGGIFLGWFINRKEKNVQALLMQVESKKKEVEKLEEKTAKTKGEIEELNDSINNDIEGLYAKLRREETITHLKRLVYEPNDIGNILPLLFSRELMDSDFKYLLTAYRNLENKNDNGIKVEGLFVQRLSSKGQYLLLFFQHFCGQSILHELVKDDIISFFRPAMECAFLNDIKNSTESLIGCLNKSDTDNKSDIIFQYISALNKSKYKTHNKLYEMIVSKCKDDFVIQSVWVKLVEANIFIPTVGELLCKRFGDDEGYVKGVQESMTELQKKQSENNE